MLCICLDLEEEESANKKHMSHTCAHWIETQYGFDYPSYTTDFLLVIDCIHLNNNILLKQVRNFFSLANFRANFTRFATFPTEAAQIHYATANFAQLATLSL